jgi:hypothetical protein
MRTMRASTTLLGALSSRRSAASKNAAFRHVAAATGLYKQFWEQGGGRSAVPDSALWPDPRKRQIRALSAAVLHAAGTSRLMNLHCYGLRLRRFSIPNGPIALEPYIHRANEIYELLDGLNRSARRPSWRGIW